MPWIIQFYTLPGGRCPTTAFIDSLPIDDQITIVDKFSRIRVYGQMLGNNWVKSIGDRLYEFRFHIRDGIIRFFFFYRPGQIIVLTHGFQKKTEKTPSAEIALAHAYMHDWLKENTR